MEINLKREFRLHPHISVLVWKRRIFFSGLTYRSHAFPENESFPKTLSRVKIFEKRWPLVYVRRDENGGFQIQWCNASFSQHNACSVREAIVLPLISVFVWTDENDSNTLGVEAYIFLKTGGKRSLICFQRYPGMCGRGLRHFHVVVVQNGKMWKKKCDARAKLLFCSLNLCPLFCWPSRCDRVVESSA